MGTISSLFPRNGYHLVEHGLLGKGSFGFVYKVEKEDPILGVQYLAVKHISIPSDETEIQRLIENRILKSEASAPAYYDKKREKIEAEIKTMAKIGNHPNIVSLKSYDIIKKKNGIGYDCLLWMQFLTPLLRVNWQSIDRVKLGMDIANAIIAMEKKNIIHRDIKPQNIMVDEDGNFMLGDYGTAKIVDQKSYSSTIAGSPLYMAPEIYKEKKADQTVDIYSLGLVLYRYYNNNRMPFWPDLKDGEPIGPDENQEAVDKRMRGEPLPPPVNADAEMTKIILKACAYDPKKRYQSGGELLEALETYERGTGDPPPKHPLKWILISVLLLVIAAGVITYQTNSWPWPPKPTPIPTETTKTTETGSIREVTPTPKPTDTSGPTVTTPPSASVLYGDVDKNGTVDIQDVIRLMKYVSGMPVDNLDMSVCDITEDGEITIFDVMRLQKMLSNWDDIT